MKTIKIAKEYITLTQALKEIGMIGTGGQAKWYLQENEVKVNGELETRRGKKLRVGDQIELPEKIIVEII
ncbi:S4 domain-containing protein YaaA [Bombilactobacillus thymidiniphilus]|uniref:S4 domain-containing protein YaaA n=1 Tax=Bombilactobacillus thymidiniphilus TaxID=2923363 RepID=A0ABY4PCG3_9LACO|nr:S4 domain-containing protein YaaA [Bombilactobacillus thymidiniphilus]UQS82962.1 S4 domain-containing protein YaaA [Bombilactobacillus thymidiniphilus]